MDVAFGFAMIVEKCRYVYEVFISKDVMWSINSVFEKSIQAHICFILEVLASGFRKDCVANLLPICGDGNYIHIELLSMCIVAAITC